MTAEKKWTEEDSRAFLEVGDVAVPGRDEQLDVLVTLIPARDEEAFAAVDLGCGEGRLAEAVLRRFPRCRLLGLDGSQTMLDKASERLQEFGDRARLATFDLESGDWPSQVSDPARCVLSSMALHHLDGEGKRAVFAQAHERTEPGGALLIADIVRPGLDQARVSFMRGWQRIAREQSLALTGSAEAYEKAVADGYDYFASPDDYPEEKPSGLFEQLGWLREAGFSTVDCFWMRAGHAIYGGYRRQEEADGNA